MVISGVAGNSAANGTWNITRLDQDQFTLDDSTGSSDSKTGGRWQEPINSHTIQIADHEISPTANISVQFFNMDGDRYDDLLVIGDDTTAASGGKRNLGYVFSGDTITKSGLSPLHVVDAATAIRSNVGLTDLQALVAGDIDGNGHEDLVFGDRNLQVQTSRVTPAQVTADRILTADTDVFQKLQLHGASVSGGELTLTNGQYAVLPASVLGDWGTDDFEVSLEIKTAGGGRISGDGDITYGSLIQRTTSESGSAFANDGPLIRLYDDGKIVFRLRSDDLLVIPNAVTSWADWVKLKFVLEASEKKLKVFVNDVEKTSRKLTKWTNYINNASTFANTEMRVGADSQSSSSDNLNAKIRNLQIEPLWRKTDLTIFVNDVSDKITVKEITGTDSAQTAAAYALQINQLLQSPETPLKGLVVASDADGHLQISTVALGNTVKLRVSEDDAVGNQHLGFDSASDIAQQTNTVTSGTLPENSDTEIADGSPVSHALAVGDLGSVLDVNVTITLTHPWVADLDIRLRGPDNREVQLACNNGDDTDHFTGTTFDDQASNDIRSGTGPFSDSYRPCGSLSTFNGSESEGSWSLIVTDGSDADDGYLRSWTLSLVTAADTMASGTTETLSTFPSDNPILFNGRVSGNLEVTLGQKDGTSPDPAFPFALGDLNNDGYDDFALSNKSGSRLNVHSGVAVTPSTEIFTAGQNVTIKSSLPIEITSTAHGLITGDLVEITGVSGNTNANGRWTVTRVDADKFTLNSSTGNAAYTSGGIWTKQHAISTATNPASGPIEITSTAHGLLTGGTIIITGVGGNTAANGTWTITTVNADKFTLNSSTASGAYTSGGHWTREYAITGAANPAGGTGSATNIGTLSTGLVAYYPLETGSGTTTTDRIGSNNGTLKGNVTWTSGKLNGGLEFNRTADSGPFTGSDYQSGWMEANGLLDGIGASGILNDTDSYTFAAWAKWAPQAAGSNSYGYVIWGANATHNVNENVMRVGIDNDADSLFAHGDGDLGSVNWADQKWHLYTITFGPDGNADFYVDGTIKVTKAQDTTDKEREKLWSTAGLFHFGMEMDTNSASDGWSGKLDELAIWNRELSAPEISALYNNGAGVILPPIEITSEAHGLATGDKVAITGVGGNTAANGTRTVTRVDADKFTLDNSVSNAAYTSGGHWTRLHDVTAATHPEPLAATAGDFDGDGSVDLAVSLVENDGRGTVSIFSAIKNALSGSKSQTLEDADFQLIDGQPLILKSTPPANTPDALSVLGRIDEPVKIVPGDQPPLTLTYEIISKTCTGNDACEHSQDSRENGSKILNYVLSAGDSIDDLVNRLNAELRDEFGLETNQVLSASTFNTKIEAVRIDTNHIGFRVSGKQATRIDLTVQRPGQQLGTLPVISQIDVNGDRLNDLVIGAPGADILGGGEDAGRIYVIQGSLGKVDLPEDFFVLENASVSGSGSFVVNRGTGRPEVFQDGDQPFELPFSQITENFESGSLSESWTTYSSNTDGRVRVVDTTTISKSAADGTHALLMDTAVADDEYILNEAVYTVDLAGVSRAKLNFSHTNYDDEVDPFYGDFVGHFDADGVAISDDGMNWHPVWSPDWEASASWEAHSIDLASAAKTAGMELGGNFRIKFQQFDNYPIDLDGRGYDKISIDRVPEQWFRFTTLGDGRGGDRIRLSNGVTDLVDADGRVIVRKAGALDLRTVEAGTYYLNVYQPDGTAAGEVTIEFDAPRRGQTHEDASLPDRDVIHGGGGDDLITGNQDLDRLYGDSGADTFFGEAIEIRDQIDPDALPASNGEFSFENSGSPLDPLVTVGPGTTAGVVFEDVFDSTSFELTNWGQFNGVAIDAIPSGGYAARFNGPGSIESLQINLDKARVAVLDYEFQNTGNGDSPDLGDDLVVKYYNGTAWEAIDRQLGQAGPVDDMSQFNPVSIILPKAALHEDFQLQFSTTGDSSHDDWFVDNIRVSIRELGLSEAVSKALGQPTTISTLLGAEYHLSELASIAELDASADPFSKSVVTDLSGTEYLVNLRTLKLRGRSLDNSDLATLLPITLTSGSLVGETFGPAELRHLDLTDNQTLEGISSLAQLPQMQTLHLAGTSLDPLADSTLSVLLNMQSLKILTLPTAGRLASGVDLAHDEGSQVSLEVNTFTANPTEVTEDWNYAGAVAVADKIYFAPISQDQVGVLDTSDNTFATIPITGVTGYWKYTGGVAMGTKIYFVPDDLDHVGVLDTTNNTFTTIDTGVTGYWKYNGAAAVGNKIYFAPVNQDHVGVLDSTNNTFTTIATGLTGDFKYRGAAAVGDKVYFAPNNQDNVGVVDTTNGTFTTIATTGVTDDWKYNGAVKAGNKIYFVPDSVDHVGVVDTTNDSFAMIPTGLSDYSQYSGAVELNGKVYLAPVNQDNVGIIDTSDTSQTPHGTFTTIATTGVTDDWKYNGAARVANKIYFGPSGLDHVGVLNTTSNTFSTISTLNQDDTDGGPWRVRNPNNDIYATGSGKTVSFLAGDEGTFVFEQYVDVPPVPASWVKAFPILVYNVAPIISATPDLTLANQGTGVNEGQVLLIGPRQVVGTGAVFDVRLDEVLVDQIEVTEPGVADRNSLTPQISVKDFNGNQVDLTQGALVFDGVNDVVELPHSVLDGAGDVTTTFWLKTPDAGSANKGSAVSSKLNGTIVSGANEVQPNEYLLYLRDDSTFVVAAHDKTIEWKEIESIADGQFHHYALVRDQGNQRLELFVDGNSQGERTTYTDGTAIELTNLQLDEGGLLVGQHQDNIGMQGDWKYNGAVAVGNKIYFAPDDLDDVGVLDTSDNTNTFTTIATGLTGDWKYHGTAAIGDKIYFAPVNQDHVGVFNKITNTFRTIPTTGVTDDWKYNGAAAVGTNVYFAPANQDHVGVLDTCDNTFTTIATGLTGDWKYRGAVAVGDKVYFVPANQDHVGVLDTSNNTFTTIATGLTGNWKYNGAVAVGGKIYFAPGDQAHVGILDTSDNTFTTIATGLTGDWKYNGAATTGSVLTLTDNQYAEISAGVMGDWGTGDFELSLGIKANSGTNIAAEGDYGTLFARSSQSGTPYTGPMVFLWNDGQVLFRIRSDDGLLLPAGTVSSWLDWVDLRFVRTGNQLKVFVNDVEKGSRTLTQTADSAQFVNAPLRFGGNHLNPSNQSLSANIRNLQVFEPPANKDDSALSKVQLYNGASVADGKVYFAPVNQDHVGVLDPSDNTFTTIATGLTGDWKYRGAVTVGDKIYFAPVSQDQVGVLDTSDNTFATIPTVGVILIEEPLTVSQPNTVINDYTALAANVAAGADKINVKDVSAFSPGDQIMVIQMQGEVSAGHYEFKTVKSVETEADSGQIDGTHATGNQGTAVITGATWSTQYTPRSNVEPKSSHAVTFDGTIADFVTLPNTVLDGLQDLTVEFWVRSTNITKPINTVFHATHTGGNDFSIEFDQYGTNVFTQYGDFSVSSAHENNKWYHVAVVRQAASNTLQIFEDGNLLGDGLLTSSAPLYITGAVVLGQEQDTVGGGFSSSQALEGQLDEVRVWKTARSPSEIGDHFQKTLGATEEGLVDAWNFEYTTNTITVDTGLDNSYSQSNSSKTQIVRVPQYTDVTVNSGGSITAAAWDGNQGGILAFNASGTVTVDSGGRIDVSGLGFRGAPQHTKPSATEFVDGYHGEGHTGGFDSHGLGGVWQIAGGAPYSQNHALPAGSYSLEMNDSYGDGWNGGEFTISPANSSAIISQTPVNQGFSNIPTTETVTFIVATAGTYTVAVSAGSYPGEVSWALTGSVVAQGGRGGIAGALDHGNAGGGGGGGHGTAGENGHTADVSSSGTSQGSGGDAVGSDSLQKLFPGGGGGSGGFYNTAGHTGPAGDGGGIIYITAASILVNGSLEANGGNATPFTGSPGDYKGGSGGGAGGTIYLTADDEILSTNIQATGGVGSEGYINSSGTYASVDPSSQRGGNGAAGRIKLHNTQLVSPTTQTESLAAALQLLSGATMSGDVITLTNSQYADIPASVAKDWGTGDFELSLKIRANSGTNIAADGDYGALFVRSSQGDPPYTGPSVFLWNNGQVLFRLRSDDGLLLPAGTVSSWSDWVDLRFEYDATANRLKVFVNDVEAGSRNLGTTADFAQFIHAPLRFGGNHLNPSGQNLSADIYNLQISEPPANKDDSALSKVQLHNGASVAGGVLTLTESQYADIPASVLGDWGTDDFELSLKIKTADGSGQIAGDTSRDYGSLMQRSTISASDGPFYYDGPMVFLFDNGEILFRLRGDDALSVPNAVSSWADWVDLKFVFNKAGKTLKLFVNDVEKGSHTLTKLDTYIDHADTFTNTFMRFGAHWDPDYTDIQNLNAKIKDLQVSGLEAPVATGWLAKLETGSGASVTNNVLTLTDSQYADIPASVMKDWGTGDFELSLDIKIADGSGKIAGDASRDYGSLLQRSTSASGGCLANDGPMIFLYDNGQILFRLRSDDGLVVPGAVSSWADWVTLKFTLNASNKTLKVFVNGTEKGSLNLTKWDNYIANADTVTNTYLRLGAHWDGTVRTRT